MIAPILISILSLLVAAGSFLFSIFAKRKADKIQHGFIELGMRQAIENSKARLNDVAMIMAPFKAKENNKKITDEEKETLRIYDKNLDAATQSLLNTYDDACSKYLDNKIDKDRFKKSYHVEIRNLLNNENLKKYFDPLTSTYKPILGVYNEWENLERN